ncbi:MAG: tRNA lysidine(34) synthetase TilS [Dehalococcoidales bacterium]|nr:MAG: tRNA lysidine(34) synthetase TilS [Dehalococcoidales bacterium]
MKEQGYQGPLELRVRDYIREHNLLAGQKRLLVAVSGGQDSAAMLGMLVSLQEELDIKLHIAHLDHQLRGVESENDARYVSQLASQLGVPVTVERCDVLTYQKKQRISLEEAAREMRYNFLALVAGSIGAGVVAVGHTKDDNIETILMHLIRGTGIQGLQGLQPVSRWQYSGNEIKIIRPLLMVTRQETVEYCGRKHIIPRVDTSNLSLSHLRNRVRQQLVPLLEKYNSQINEALLRTARIAGDELSYLEEEIAKLWGSVIYKQAGTIIINKGKFLELPSALQRQLLRTVIEELLGSLKDIETRHIEEIMAILNKPAGKQLCLPGGLVLIVEYERYLIGPDPAALCPFPVLEGHFTLNIPGKTLFPGWCVVAKYIEREQMEDKGGNLTAYLDRDEAGAELTVRCRQPGDRFQPVGMSQLKKLGEFMIDAKIPHAWRQRIPILCSPQHILWVVGWRIDDRIKVTENTRQVLCLEFERAGGNPS